MKDFIRALDKRTINIFFGGIYALALILALFPPLYLSASGSGVVILGLPLPIAYWLADALVLGLGLWVPAPGRGHPRRTRRIARTAAAGRRDRRPAGREGGLTWRSCSPCSRCSTWR